MNRQHRYHAGSSIASAVPVPAETADANVKTNDDLMMALQASRDQVPALNFHGACVLLVLQFNVPIINNQ